MQVNDLPATAPDNFNCCEAVLKEIGVFNWEQYIPLIWWHCSISINYSIA